MTEWEREAAAVLRLEHHRWGDEPQCVRCLGSDTYRVGDGRGGRNRRFLWQCRTCRAQYTVKTDTLMERSHAPVWKWEIVMRGLSNPRRRGEVAEAQRLTGLQYKSVLRMVYRIEAERASSPRT